MTPTPKHIMEVQRASQRWWVPWTIMWKPARKAWNAISFHRGMPSAESPDLAVPEKEKPDK